MCTWVRMYILRGVEIAHVSCVRPIKAVHVEEVRRSLICWHLVLTQRFAGQFGNLSEKNT
jgi:hypothetical protein